MVVNEYTISIDKLNVDNNVRNHMIQLKTVENLDYDVWSDRS